MENLINFDENENNQKKSSQQTPKKSMNNFSRHPLLVNDRLSLELNNPFDTLEYNVIHSSDPFECLFTKQNIKSENNEKDCNE